MPVEPAFDQAILGRRRDLDRRHIACEPDGEPCIGLRVEDQLTLLLAHFARQCGSIGPVHPDREFFAGEQILHKRLRHLGRGLEPDLTDPLAFGRREGCRQRIAALHLFGHLRRQQARVRRRGAHWFAAPGSLPTA